MLWLALYFPHLAVEACAAPAPAVTAAGGRVIAADAAASAAGVGAGMRLASALALLPTLTVCASDPRRERAALETLACWSGNFSPQVSLVAPDLVLLEIGGCLGLFGGLAALLDALATGCAGQGHAHRLGLAPTPLAAEWFARAGRAAPDHGQRGQAASPAAGAECPAGLASGDAPSAALEHALSVLPVTVLDADAQTARRLAALGLRTLGALFELPAASLARRFGPALPQQLARARGEMPDPRPPFAFPAQFARTLELPARVEHSDRLLFAARRLLLALAGWLQARMAGVRSCSLELIHEHAPPTRLELGFAAPTRDPERLLRVLGERLATLTLAAPVSALQLSAAVPEDLPGATAGLFGAAAGAALAPVIERLRARLGTDAVHGLAAVPDHRPECATRPAPWPASATAPAAPASPPSPARPLWLLPAPRALAERDGAPWQHGRLRLLTRAERIESGWWDGGEGVGDLRRDYFVALSAKGEWLWVFRDATGWWLHGLFA